MVVLLAHVTRTIRSKIWCVVVTMILAVAMETTALDGPNVCMVKQKYNITKRVKYRAPMSVRTYEWCFSMPPRCSKWNTEMRDLTRLETEERTAEVAVCCPGYKMKDVSCVPICPNGKTGPGCSEACPDNKWGPNCIHDCKKCKNGFCSPLTGECECLEGWQGESCDSGMPTTTSTTTLEELLTSITNMPPNTTPKPITSTVTKSKPLRTSLLSNTELITSPPPSTRTIVISSNVPTSSSAEQISRKEIISLMISTEPTTVAKTTELIKTTEEYTELPSTSATLDLLNITSTAIPTTSFKQNFDAFTQRVDIAPIYNRTEIPLETNKVISNKTIKNVQVTKEMQKEFSSIMTTEIPKSTSSMTTRTTTTKIETMKKEATRLYSTTVKIKPKEIWIRPAQKGESPIVEAKIKPVHEHPRYRSASNKDFTPANTTPKTIIVSIIPTSVSYSTYKKLALTTASLIHQRIITGKFHTKPENEVTKPMPVTATSTPELSIVTRDYLNSTTSLNKHLSLFLPVPSTVNVTTYKPNPSIIRVSTTPKTTTLTTKSLKTTKSVSLINKTNSTNDVNATNTFTSVTSSTNVRILGQHMTTKTTLTTPATKAKSNDTITPNIGTLAPVLKRNDTFTKDVKEPNLITSKVANTDQMVPKLKDFSEVSPKDKIYTKVTGKDFKKTNITKTLTKTTEGPTDDEEFHILTEPEHITAVMGDKGADRSSIDLISVISIAGGVMMAVITVAVIIVMIERCKKPRYEDVRKMNDITMQVMIDNSDEPPPYVRSIFHTPLPDPPTMSEKCHYQPISTLDRSLKQFMRPVVVQTISPIMLENFRDILECHYDHLPRRSHDIGTIRSCCSVTPSVNDCGELRHLRASVTECTIDALKCEAKLDEIDNTNTEPLYAEIPCWRPQSEHALEIMNLNGEAVTEL